MPACQKTHWCVMINWGRESIDFEALILYGKIEILGRIKFSCLKTIDYMQQLPQVSVPLLAKELQMIAPTARSTLEHMVKLGILEEISGKKRDKAFVYSKYLSVLEHGAHPI